MNDDPERVGGDICGEWRVIPAKRAWIGSGDEGWLESCCSFLRTRERREGVRDGGWAECGEPNIG